VHYIFRKLPAFLSILFTIVLGNCSAEHESQSDAVRFDRLARDAFEEVYPSLAEQILGDYGIREGICLDIGCGPAYLGIEIAKRSRLRVIGVDIDPEAVQIARKNIKRENLQARVTAEEGNAEKLRFLDASSDLIVSRGSFLFWENTAQGFREIYRVLKPGGVAFVGGGMGRSISPEEKEAIKRKVEQAGLMHRCKNKITPVMMQEILESVNIQKFRIMGDGPGDSGCRCGMWIEIRK
jgi:SAM-dependent methyltransferase